MIFNKTLLYYQSIQSKKLYEDKWYVTRIYGNNKDEQIWKIFLHPEKGILRCASFCKHSKKFPVIPISGF